MSEIIEDIIKEFGSKLTRLVVNVYENEAILTELEKDLCEIKKILRRMNE